MGDHNSGGGESIRGLGGEVMKCVSWVGDVVVWVDNLKMGGTACLGWSTLNWAGCTTNSLGSTSQACYVQMFLFVDP